MTPQPHSLSAEVLAMSQANDGAVKHDDDDDDGAVKLNILQQHMLGNILSSPGVGDIDGVDEGPGQDGDHVVVGEGEP